MAQVAFTGRLSKDVTTRYTQDGKAIASFDVAESIYVGKGKAKDGKDYGTEWWSVTLFGPLAATLSDKIGKGDTVTIMGDTQSREYQDKEGAWQLAKSSKVTAKTVVPHVKKAAPAPADADEDLADLLN